MHSKKLGLLFVLPVLILAGCDSGEKYKLAIEVEEGATYEMKMDVDMSSGGGGQSMAMGMKMTANVSFLDKSEDSYRQSIHFTRMVMDIDGGMQEVHYDSDDTDMDYMQEMMHEQLKGLLENPITAKMSKSGELVGEIDYGDLDASLVDQMDQAVNGMGISFPEEEVGIGDEWEGDITVNGGMEITYVYELKDVTADEYIISAKADIDESLMGISMKGTARGRMILDRKTCMLKESHINMDMSGGPISMRARSDIEVTKVK